MKLNIEREADTAFLSEEKKAEPKKEIERNLTRHSNGTLGLTGTNIGYLINKYGINSREALYIRLAKEGLGERVRGAFLSEGKRQELREEIRGSFVRHDRGMWKLVEGKRKDLMRKYGISERTVDRYIHAEKEVLQATPGKEQDARSLRLTTEEIREARRTKRPHLEDDTGDSDEDSDAGQTSKKRSSPPSSSPYPIHNTI